MEKRDVAQVLTVLLNNSPKQMIKERYEVAVRLLMVACGNVCVRCWRVQNLN